jgi:hypothetical protein
LLWTELFAVDRDNITHGAGHSVLPPGPIPWTEATPGSSDAAGRGFRRRIA